ncbi:MAG: pilus assembly protein TadG-related protein [Sphingomicrobium sp.]
MMRLGQRLWRSTDGAVAPTVALTLTALIAVGGIAFDYSRLASLDTELQDAADQAALAAASQLDQTNTNGSAITRATAAAQSLLTNRTLMANDSNGSAITIPSIVFYATKADAEADTNPVTDPASYAIAHFVRVTVATRRARYALTPIVAAFNSGDVGAQAVAGLGSSICKVPPVMVCNPQETAGSTSFNATSLVGKGLKLVSVGNGSGTWSPGNFGYLDTGGGSSGAPGLRQALGWGTAPGSCLAQSGISTKPGASTSVTDALNTRFDIYDNQSCPAGGSCPASINSVKDVGRSANASGNNACRLQNAGWREGTTATAYEWGAIPTSPTTALPTTTTPSVMGHPRDMCHAVPSGTSGRCTGPIGDGNWDRDAYFRTNYLRTTNGVGGVAGTRWSSANWRTNTGLSTSVAVTAANYASRYNVYVWEIANRGTTKDGVVVLGPRVVSGNGASAFTSYSGPVCSASQGYGSGQIPGPSLPDRRRISAAVVNCTANNVNGSSTNVPVQDWIELFLVEPSINRGSATNAGDVYAEVISETRAGAGTTAGQVIRRDVPYLVK